MKRLPLGIFLLVIMTLAACTQTGNPDTLNPAPTTTPAAIGDVIAFDMVGSVSQNLLSHTNAFAGAFASSGDGFEKYQRGVSATIPFSVLDDSLVSFPPDSQGIVDDNNLDEFFGVTDTENPDNSGPVSASWLFDVSGFDAGSAAGPLTLSIDIGAMGDFEASDSFIWSYSFDGGSSQTAFASTVDEAGSNSYALAGGGVFTLQDPMLVDSTILTNVFATFSAPLSGSGNELTVTLRRRLGSTWTVGGEGGRPIRHEKLPQQSNRAYE